MDQIMNATAIQYVADKLGIAVQQVYTVYVSVQAAFGILTILSVIGGAIGFYLGWIIGQKKCEDDPEFMGPIFAFAGAIGLGLGIFIIGQSILQIMYPQYFAIDSMLRAIVPQGG